MRECW